MNQPNAELIDEESDGAVLCDHLVRKDAVRDQRPDRGPNL